MEELDKIHAMSDGFPEHGMLDAKRDRSAWTLLLERCKAVASDSRSGTIDCDAPRGREISFRSLPLEDMFVSQSLELFNKDGTVPGAHLAVEQPIIVYENEGSCAWFQMPRAVQLLKEICWQHTSRMTAQKVLQATFPPEIINMVAQYLIKLHGIP